MRQLQNKSEESFELHRTNENGKKQEEINNLMIEICAGGFEWFEVV